jgi:hypothetical protein
MKMAADNKNKNITAAIATSTEQSPRDTADL